MKNNDTSNLSRLGHEPHHVVLCAVLAVAVLVFAGGCQTGPVPANPIQETDRVLVASEIRNCLEAKVIPDWTPDRRLKATVIIRNVTSKILYVYVSTMFTDESGKILNPDPVQDASPKLALLVIVPTS